MFDIRPTLGQNLSLQSLWGRNKSDIFFVGRNGSVAHYNGEEWQKLESGTSLNINDIWGSRNPRTGDWEVLAVAYNSFSSNEKRVLQILKESVASLPDGGLGPGMYSIWFEAGKRYFIGGNDLYQTVDPEKSWETNTHFQPGFRGSKAAVRGNGLNDMVVVGTYGLVMHFNGASWQIYEDQQLLPTGAYTSLDVKEDIVVAGGAHEGKGIILIGKR